MEAHLLEWLNLTVRWIHLIVGVAWIGASFHFVWLENNLERDNPREGLSGDLWAIHGGGIYHLEKHQLAPATVPQRLHWFKWEAYSTWLSGVCLLLIVYYLQPTLYLLEPGVELAPLMAIGLGFGSLIAGWFVYDLLCASPLGRRPVLLGAVLFGLLVLAGWGYSQLFSGRAAYIHTGALLGTLMVGNVFCVIIPAQRALVKAMKEHRQADPRLPAKGLLRSRHNNYFTLPVLFSMISNHFPSTYGSPYNWLILAGLAALAVLVRHGFNTRHAGRRLAWALPVAALGLLTLALVTTPTGQPVPAPPTAAQAPATTREPPAAAPPAGAAANPEFAQVEQIIHQRCAACHAARPSSPIFSSAPAGVMFDTPQQIQQQAARIRAQTVATSLMPLGNITRMTAEERRLLGQWIDKGAPID